MRPPGTATIRSSVRAREVLNAAAQAHGGLDNLRGLTSLHRAGKGKTYTQGQNLGPDTPAIVRDLETDQWLDFAGNRARVENKTAFGGIPFHGRNVLAGDSGYAWNAATGASTRFTPTGGTGLRNALRRDPARLIAMPWAAPRRHDLSVPKTSTENRTTSWCTRSPTAPS